MEKLLHERLREHKKGDIVEFNGYATSLLPKEACALADEIERYYIPRPRYEDGEPIQWNDEYQADSGKTAKLTQIYLRCNGRVVLGRNGKRTDLPWGTYIKHPQPKVLDADGVEINVGDTVWYVEYADGGDKYTVTAICSTKDCVIADKDNGGSGYHLQGYFLTHKEPDSIEQVNTDSMLNSYEYCKLILRNGTEIKRDNESRSERKVRMRKAKMDDLLKRHRALIERGA